jgi:hypothetical protein
MTDDRRVKGRSDDEVRRHAKNSKVDYKVDRLYPVNVLRILRSGSVQTLFGRKKLVFVVVDDKELGAVDAKTEFSASTVTITAKRGVEERAALGVGRDRMTLAHELGHATMHSGEVAFRHTGAAGTTSLSAISAYESAEHQAKVFAATFLIHDELATGVTAEEISERFVVSLEAAQLCFERLQKKAERARSAERVMRMNQEVKAALLGPKPAQARYIEDVCTVCTRQTLVPRGTQVECETCGFKGDRFQDGDRAA